MPIHLTTVTPDVDDDLGVEPVDEMEQGFGIELSVRAMFRIGSN
jgi:hypothetical protein